MKKITILCILLLCVVTDTMAQKTVTVSGIVSDSNKEPLIGVNIIVKDVPGLGAITDINGKYTIKVEPYNRLVFSYIGYKTQEVLIKEQRSVNIKMEEDQRKRHRYRHCRFRHYSLCNRSFTRSTQTGDPDWLHH